MSLLFATWIKFFFLFAPFFVLSMFLALTRGETTKSRRQVANKAIIAAAAISVVLIFFGGSLFAVLGITLDSFRIGSGILLFMSALSLVKDGTRNHATGMPNEQREDISVVPLAVPTIIGPATIGTILVYGADFQGWDLLIGLMGLFLALLSLGIILYSGSLIEKLLGPTGLNILSKITGLILSAMAAQIFMSGVMGFLTPLVQG
ncbi:MAG: MarC family protein [Marinomonas sp.]|uniref:MarC family protein n=1 Tax=unclassified Marinomonas TaxID=196814 RepID=UPI0007AF2830|nr:MULTISPECIES: MarC family protein [unclassified Marinomonas]KZM40290.1 membrane protein [Marinomonas sp. SBI22]KZM41707.1 membrane protein [Marinomonas sp. SBI8L]